ncbi:NADP-dependent oxidoreductase [Nonomuraea sp. NPDC049141]|uniref:NADP-dependent oxidoreductase n=1 Tax=Nonomuraea sp. NPDC049141 TaxID=3155500 RepID=UPI0033CE46B2
MISREIHLVRHPQGAPRLSDFRLVETVVPEPRDDQVLVHNRYFALAAVMRTLMSGVEIGMPLGTYRPGQVLFGSAIGEVVDAGPAAPDGLRFGDLVMHHYGWREYVVEAADRFRRLDPGTLPDPILHLGQGLTAYAGLLRVALPDGIDVCFDNVGGEQLAAAIELARPGARYALCGALDNQLGGRSAAVSVDPVELIGRRLTLSGFHVADHRDLQEPWLEDFSGWLREGRIDVPRVVVPGLDAAPAALISLLSGGYTGMVVVAIG